MLTQPQLEFISDKVVPLVLIAAAAGLKQMGWDDAAAGVIGAALVAYRNTPKPQPPAGGAAPP